LRVFQFFSWGNSSNRNKELEPSCVV
jgi:hypothetical protein